MVEGAIKAKCRYNCLHIFIKYPGLFSPVSASIITRAIKSFLDHSNHGLFEARVDRGDLTNVSAQQCSGIRVAKYLVLIAMSLMFIYLYCLFLAFLPFSIPKYGHFLGRKSYIRLLILKCIQTQDQKQYMLQFTSC